MLEIEGLEDLKCEQAFELSDASAERSAAGCTIKLSPEPIKEYMTSNMVMLKWMLSEGYGDKRTIERRIASMQVRVQNTTALVLPSTATAQMNHTLAHQAACYQHSTGASLSLSNPLIETISQSSHARRCEGF